MRSGILLLCARLKQKEFGCETLTDWIDATDLRCTNASVMPLRDQSSPQIFRLFEEQIFVMFDVLTSTLGMSRERLRQAGDDAAAATPISRGSSLRCVSLSIELSPPLA